jgi:carbon-monoxide dehydrogenase large subunit
MDLIAKELALDPLAVRAINCIRKEEFPYVTPSGNQYDSGDYHRLLERAANEFDFEELRRMQIAARKEGR